MSYYWISWYHENNGPQFELHFPWWVSGYDMNDRSTICAAVYADSEEAAEEVVLASYDERPENIEWRFNTFHEGPIEFSGRFPKADWMTREGF